MRNTATVGFIMSHACPLACDFCCHDRQVLGKGRVRREAMEQQLVNFGRLAPVTRFAFSGGEPFLYFRDIVDAMASARRAGVSQPFHMVTSAHWAKQGGVREKLQTLLDVGLEGIHLSYDEEHAKWVAKEEIREVATISREMGVRVEIYASFWNKGESIYRLLPDADELADEVHEFAVVRSGRAARSGRRTTVEVAQHTKYSCGRAAHYSIAIHPDGNVFPCCGGDFNQAAKLSCGNIHDYTAEKILENAFSNFHVRMAKELGWDALYDFIGREFPDLASELTPFSEVDSPCEICRDLNLKLKDRLVPVYQHIEMLYAQTMAESEMNGRAREMGPRSFRFDGKCGSKEDILRALGESGEARRRYVAGVEQIAAS